MDKSDIVSYQVEFTEGVGSFLEWIKLKTKPGFSGTN